MHAPKYFALLLAAVSIVVVAESRTKAERVQIGKGSYTTTPPSGMKRPPRAIFQTENVTGKMQTTD